MDMAEDNLVTSFNLSIQFKARRQHELLHIINFEKVYVKLNIILHHLVLV